MTDRRLPTIPEEVEESVIDVSELREELVDLAEAGDIKYTPKHIKKSNRGVLERIKRDYIRKQTDEANDFISDNIIAKVSELMKVLEMIEEPDKMGNELKDNKLVKRDLKNIVGHITPYIPLLGLLCGGVIVGKHVISTKYPDKDVVHKYQEPHDQQQEPETQQHQEPQAQQQ